MNEIQNVIERSDKLNYLCLTNNVMNETLVNCCKNWTFLKILTIESTTKSNLKVEFLNISQHCSQLTEFTLRNATNVSQIGLIYIIQNNRNLIKLFLSIYLLNADDDIAYAIGMNLKRLAHLAYNQVRFDVYVNQLNTIMYCFNVG